MLKFQEKIFIADHGIRQAIYGSNMRDIQQTLENIVYMELLRRGYKVTVGKNNTNEIDFVASYGSDKIVYLLASEETVEREFSQEYTRFPVNRHMITASALLYASHLPSGDIWQCG